MSPTGTSGIFSHDVPSTESSYMISSLTADTEYLVTVQPKSFGSAGKEMQWKTVVPRASGFVIFQVLKQLQNGQISLAELSDR